MDTTTFWKPVKSRRNHFFLWGIGWPALAMSVAIGYQAAELSALARGQSRPRQRTIQTETYPRKTAGPPTERVRYV